MPPADLVEYEAEFRIALAETDDDFDLSRVQAVLDKWWGITHFRIHPPTAEERAVAEKVAQGDFSGMYEQTSTGVRRID